MSRRSLVLALLLLPASLAGQAPIVVDEAGGPGSHYTDLPQAVAAAPSGSHLLLRPGNYSSFSIMGKALHIRGSGVAATTVKVNRAGGPVSVSAVPAGSIFVIEELKVAAELYLMVEPKTPFLLLKNGRFLLQKTEIQAAAGIYHLFFPVHGAGVVEVQGAVLHGQELGIAGSVGPASGSAMPAALHATGSLLQLHQCRFTGLVSVGINNPAKNGQAGLNLAGSTAELFRCDVWGGTGSDRSSTAMGGDGLGGDGGPGVLLEGASLLLVDGGSIRGGNKGYVQGMMWTYPGLNFGAGMAVQAGSAARLRGATLAPGGTGAPPWTGAGVVKEIGPPLDRPELVLTRTTVFPDGHRLRVKGAPGRLLLLAASPKGAWIPLGPFGLEGTLYLDAAGPGFLLLGGVAVPAGGSWVLDLPGLPLPGVIGPWWLQAFMAPEGSQTIASNPVCLSLWP